MKHIVLAACLGALTLTSAGAALAQEPAKKPAATKKTASKKTTKKTEAAAPVEARPAKSGNANWAMRSTSPATCSVTR
jgi:spore germination cell wall hydrolase CwlJ-like protein